MSRLPHWNEWNYCVGLCRAPSKIKKVRVGSALVRAQCNIIQQQIISANRKLAIAHIWQSTLTCVVCSAVPQATGRCEGDILLQWQLDTVIQYKPKCSILLINNPETEVCGNVLFVYPLAMRLYQHMAMCCYTVVLLLLMNGPLLISQHLGRIQEWEKKEKVWGHSKFLTGFVGQGSWMDMSTQTESVLKAMYRKPLVSGLKIQDKMAPDMRTDWVLTWVPLFLSERGYILIW